MTANQLFDELNARGARLWIKNGNLCSEAPNGVITTAVAATIVAARPQLMAILLSAPNSLRTQRSSRDSKNDFESDDWIRAVDVLHAIKAELHNASVGPWVPEPELLGALLAKSYTKNEIRVELARWEKNRIVAAHRPKTGPTLWRYLPPGDVQGHFPAPKPEEGFVSPKAEDIV